MLQEKGAVDAEDHPTSILTNRDDMTSADRQWAARYKPGEDVVRYREGSAVFGIGKGEYGRVTAQDFEQNTLTVEFDDGRRVTYDPRRLYGVEVFREAERNFSVGDRIQFRRPFGRQAVNGELATVEKIEGGRFTVKTKDGAITIDTKTFRHFDFGYAITSYLSQGQTSEREIVHIDTRSSDVLVNRRTARVALTRGVKNVLIVTDSLDRLAEALGRSKDKEIAGSAVRESAWFEALKAAEREAQEASPRHEAGAEQSSATGAGTGSRLQNLQDSVKAPAAVMEASHPPAESSQPGFSNGLRQDKPLRQAAPERKDRTFKRTVTQYQFAEREESTSLKLVRVKRRCPCPICEKTDWCSVREDGAFAICMRVPSEETTANGGWKHVLEDGISKEAFTAVTVEVKQHRRAGIERRDGLHRELLGTLNLTERDRKNLVNRGLNEATIERNGYKSVPLPSGVDDVMDHFKDQDLSGIPGFYKDEGKWRLNIGAWRGKDGIEHSFHQGFLIPVRDLQGRIEGFQVRRAKVKNDEPRYIWLSSSSKEEGASSGAPIHFRNPERARESGQAILTEGALKGDTAAHLLGNQHCLIALAGVSNFQEDFGRRLREQMPEVRQIVIAFDADAPRIHEVRQQLERLSKTLSDAGLDVRKLVWNESQGKGLDDYLLKDAEHRNGVGDFLRESLASLNQGEVPVTSSMSRNRPNSLDESRPHRQEIAL